MDSNEVKARELLADYVRERMAVCRKAGLPVFDVTYSTGDSLTAALSQQPGVPEGWRVQRNKDDSIGVFAPVPADGESRRTSHAIYPSDRSDFGELMFKYFSHVLAAAPQPGKEG